MKKEALIQNKLEALYLAGEREIPLPKKTSAKQPASKLILPQTALLKKDAPSDDKLAELKKLREFIGDCTRCRLCEQRTKLVFGDGNPDANLMFVGEAPGRDEDMQGLPFVGRAGQLLTKIIEAMKLTREQVYIANVVKCRPETATPPPTRSRPVSPSCCARSKSFDPRSSSAWAPLRPKPFCRPKTRLPACAGTFTLGLRRW